MEKTIPNFKAKCKGSEVWVRGSYFTLHHNDNRDHIHHFIIPDGAPIPKGTPIDKVQVEIDPESLILVDDSGEEILVVKRKRVQEMYPHFNNHNTFNRGVVYALNTLFGNKCLPDQSISKTESTTPIPSNSGELKSEITENEKKPKFKVGDYVFVENGYDPYNTTIHDIKHEEGIGYSYLGDDGEWIEESKLHTQPEPKENKPMKEKELNLVAILKECNPKTFYSPAFGIITLKNIDTEDDKPLYWGAGFTGFYTYPDGRIYKDSQPTIYPSKELYEKYPLEPRKAWQEWIEKNITEVSITFDHAFGILKDVIPSRTYTFPNEDEGKDFLLEVDKAMEEIYNKRKESDQ